MKRLSLCIVFLAGTALFYASCGDSSGDSSGDMKNNNGDPPCDFPIVSFTPLEGDINEGNRPERVVMSDTHGFVTTSSKGPVTLIVYDATNPAQPVELGRFEQAGEMSVGTVGEILVAGDQLFLHGGFSADLEILILDISDPSAPTQVGTFERHQASPHGGDIAAAKGYLYISDLVFPENLSAENQPDGQIVVVDILDLAAPTEVDIVDVSARDQPGLVSDGETLFVGRVDADTGDNVLTAYSLDNPATPTPIGSVVLEAALDGWAPSDLSRALALDDGYVYGSMQGSLSDDLETRIFVVNVNDPTAMQLTGVGKVGGKISEFSEIAVEGDRAVLRGGNVWPVFVDVGDPTAPVQLGQWSFSEDRIDKVKASGEDLNVHSVGTLGNHAWLLVGGGNSNESGDPYLEDHLDVLDLNGCP